jgi:hypothetical protein
LKLVQGGSGTAGLANSGEVSCAKLARPAKVSLSESFGGADKNPLPYRYFAYVHQIVHGK